MDNLEVNIVYKKLFTYLPSELRKKIQKKQIPEVDNILEIRLRINQPLHIITRKNDIFIKDIKISKKDLKKAILILTENSLYALQRQMQEGFITITGGHRVGLTGQIITEDNKIKTIKNINSINYRLTREVIG